MPTANVQAGSLATDSASSTTIAVTFGSTVGSGNAVVGVVTWGSSTTTDLSSVSDDQSNVYTIKTRVADSGNGQSAATFYCLNITNAPQTVTATFGSAQSWRGMSVQEASGVATSAADDGGVGQVDTAPGTGTDGLTSTSITTTANGDYVFVGGVMTGSLSGGSNEFTAGTGPPAYTEPTGAEYITAGEISISSEYHIQTSAGSINGLFTVSIDTAHICIILALKAAGGGGGGASGGKLLLLGIGG